MCDSKKNLWFRRKICDSGKKSVIQIASVSESKWTYDKLRSSFMHPAVSQTFHLFIYFFFVDYIYGTKIQYSRSTKNFIFNFFVAKNKLLILLDRKILKKILVFLLLKIYILNLIDLFYYGLFIELQNDGVAVCNFFWTVPFR